MILSGVFRCRGYYAPGYRGASANDQKTNWRTLSKLFARAGVVRVRQDGETRALLPGAEVTSLEDLLDILGRWGE
jgi:hypothetical protein